MAVPLYIFFAKFNDAWHIQTTYNDDKCLDAEVILTTAYYPLERAARVGLGLLTRLMHANNS